jgi:hypothetical protein
MAIAVKYQHDSIMLRKKSLVLIILYRSVLLHELSIFRLARRANHEIEYRSSYESSCIADYGPM